MQDRRLKHSKAIGAQLCARAFPLKQHTHTPQIQSHPHPSKHTRGGGTVLDSLQGGGIPTTGTPSLQKHPLWICPPPSKLCSTHTCRAASWETSSNNLLVSEAGSGLHAIQKRNAHRMLTFPPKKTRHHQRPRISASRKTAELHRGHPEGRGKESTPPHPTPNAVFVLFSYGKKDMICRRNSGLG